MKNIIKKIVISILLILPIYIQADTFDNEVNSTNEYLYRSDYRNDYDRYLLDGQRLQIMFGFKGGKIELSSKFTMGGFISNDEYEITKINGSSYLYEGIEYWTLTGNNAGDKYKVIGETEEKGKNEIYRNRTTEYVLSDVGITGSGTSRDPWVFVPIYKVEINAQNGTVEYPNGNVTSNELVIKVIPKSGYRYITNDCENYIINYNPATNEISFKNVNRDLECNVIFGIGLYKIQVGDTGEVAEPKTIYSRYNEGFYKDNVGQNVIRNLTKLPTKVGYTFRGYEYIDGQGTKTQIIDQTGKIDNTKSGLITEDTTLKSKWEANKYTVTFNANGGEVAQTTMQVTFDSQYGTLPVAKKLGSGFDGWYTAATGGTKITNTTIVNTANDHILYAHYTQCTAGNYTNGTTGACTKCPDGYTVSAGAGTTINTCKITVPAGKKLSAQNVSTFSNCPAGSYSTSHTVAYGSSDSCTPCPDGYTVAEGQGTAQDKCGITVPAGQRLTAKNVKTFTDCLEGTYNTSHTVTYGNDDSCKECTPPMTSDRKASACTVYMISAATVECEVATPTGGKSLSYTGECEFKEDGLGNWRLKFLTSGILTVNANINIDVFLVGRGNSGGTGCCEGSVNASAGRGGSGGKYLTTLDVNVNKGSYEIRIGGQKYNNVSKVASSAFDLSSDDGKNGISGGRGGGWDSTCGCAPSGYGTGLDGGKGVPAFEDESEISWDNTYYSAGGGGGAINGGRGYGGTSGGGAGCRTVPCESYCSGKANTGGGGGGGSSYYGGAAAGGTGVVIIRNKR